MIFASHYDDADRRMAKLVQWTTGEIQRLSTLAHFDDLHVMRTKREVSAAFKRINRRSKKCFREIYEAAFDEGLLDLDELDMEIKVRHPDIDKAVERVLRGYNPVTKYVYNNEMPRKEARCVEAIVATEGNQALRKQLKTELRYLLLQERQYGDNMVYTARLDAFRENGVHHVIWRTQRDDRVCLECNELNGIVYAIDSVPDTPHYGCRCYVEPWD